MVLGLPLMCIKMYGTFSRATCQQAGSLPWGNMHWHAEVLAFDQLCPGSAMCQQEDGSGRPHSEAHVTYVKQVCQSATPRMCANRTMLTANVCKYTLNVSWGFSLC